MFEFNEMQKLRELFSYGKPDNSDEEDFDLDDGTSEPKKEGVVTETEEKKVEKPKKVNPYTKVEPKPRPENVEDPFDYDFLLNDGEKPVSAEWKKTPKWDISYKQQVTASDVYLQMGFKNPSTASCEDMIVTVELPGDKHQNMDLKILEQKLTLTSPQYYLDINLPHPVDPQKGNAQWDSEKEKLTITLRMNRELDLVNF